MENNKKYFRTLNFDLSDDKLKQYYPKKNIKQAWYDIEKYLTSNGFNHRQYSGYLSDEPLYEYNLLNITNKLFTEMPWLIKCATKFDAATVTETFDLLQNYLENCSVEDIISNDVTVKENPPEKNQEDFSFKQGSEKSKKTNMITQPVRTEVTLEQATKMAQAGIPFQIMHGDNQKVMAVFDKSDIDKVKQIKNLSSKQTRGR